MNIYVFHLEADKYSLTVGISAKNIKEARELQKAWATVHNAIVSEQVHKV